MTQVISIRKKNLLQAGYRDLQHWLENPNHLYIGRNMSYYVPGAVASKWANPFPVKKYGLAESLRLYRGYILGNKDLMGQLDELQGKILGCWCREPDQQGNPELLCHGDVLIELTAGNKQKKEIFFKAIDDQSS